MSEDPALIAVVFRLVDQVEGLQRNVAALVARQPLAAEQGSTANWVPVKATARAGYSTETIRRWAEAGLVRAELRGGRRLWIRWDSAKSQSTETALHLSVDR
jgi:hypothetical protein